MKAINYYSSEKFSAEDYGFDDTDPKTPGPHFLKLLQRHLPPGFKFTNGLLVDLGVGTGDSSRLFLDTFEFAALYGVDGSPKMLEVLNKRFLEKKLPVKHLKTQQADLVTDSIDLADNCADLVICFLTVAYLEKLDNLFSEAHRILKPGGYLGFNVHTHMHDKVLPLIDGGGDEIEMYTHSKYHLFSLAMGKNDFYYHPTRGTEGKMKMKINGKKTAVLYNILLFQKK